ncbi:hypothetical protein [Ferruginibacter sp. HRS2-29]|uniref:hypothetical protein n=1 Tax=Ferruginibacter sp. HRS2-29 TaxID=2487334 RepID=UPI0020CD39AE|nr:hypothetical protein [Ferruginibacter sp. HRS2-29]MCP9751258.1 hypothetical protein [Ferruginibacter sp. HRS2-29]
MGQLYIPSAKKIQGPWFLGIKELEELSEIFEFVESKIDESMNLEIENKSQQDILERPRITLDEARKENRINFLKHYSSKVVLVSSDYKQLTDKHLKGVLKDSRLKDFKPKELRFDVDYNFRKQFSFSVQKRYDGEISYNVKCFDENCEEEIKYKIENWLEDNKPKRIMQLWSQFHEIIGVISFIVIMSASASIVSYELPDFKTGYRSEINKILEEGIDKDNQAKATELLLKYTTDYKPSNVKEIKKVNYFQLKVLVISLFTFLISIFSPKTIIGIGRHRQLLKIYIFYSRIVIITLPSIFIIPPIIDWIKNLLIN